MLIEIKYTTDLIFRPTSKLSVSLQSVNIAPYLNDQLNFIYMAPIQKRGVIPRHIKVGACDITPQASTQSGDEEKAVLK